MSYARTITAIGASGPISSDNEVYLVDGSTGPIGNTGMLLTLPSILSDGMSHTFRRIDNGATGTIVTLTGFNITQTIDGLSAITIPPLSDITLNSYGGVWYTVESGELGIGGNVILTFNFTGDDTTLGLRTSSNSWLRAGTFVYNGTLFGPTIITGYVIMYTTDTNTYHRARIYDRTNTKIVATGTPLNTGTSSLPIIVNLGTFSNLPTNQSLFEIQILATNSSGNTGISFRDKIGLFALQLYG